MFFSSQNKKNNIFTPTTILNSTPAENASGVSVFDPITITFNQAINSTTLYVSSEPSEEWSVVQSAPNAVNLEHAQYLRVATTYTITILQDGNLIGTLTFETAHEQNDPRQLQTLQSELNKDYPLASLTPYETSDYRIVYSAPLTLEIQLKGSIKAQDAISQVQSWVKSNGIDPSTHKYIVVNASPSPSPAP
jgi:methionine-rich copper-binding protein CopC